MLNPHCLLCLVDWLFLIQATEQQIEEAGGWKKQPEAGGVSSGYKKVVSGLFEYGQNAVHIIFFFLGIQKVAGSVFVVVQVYFSGNFIYI